MKRKLPNKRKTNIPLYSQENKVESGNIIYTGSLTIPSSATRPGHPTPLPPKQNPTASSGKGTAELAKSLGARMEEVLFSSEDEERESVREQRQRYKHHLTGPASASQSHQGPHSQSSLISDAGDNHENGSNFSHIDADPPHSNNNQEEERERDPASSLSSSILPISSHSPSSPQHHILSLSIQDFSLHPSHLTAMVGDVVVFSLSPSVPAHVEHLLYGESDVPELCFESPLLSPSGLPQESERRGRFLFCLRRPGRVAVSCYIYPDLRGRIDVRERAQGETDEEEREAEGERGREEEGEGKSEGGSSSFEDSDRGEGEGGSVSERVPLLPSLNAPPLHSPSVSLSSIPSAPSSPTSNPLSRPPPPPTARHVVQVGEYTFSPPYLSPTTRDPVLFALSPSSPSSLSIRLECEGEFEEVLLSPSAPSFLHIFRREGVHEVKNGVYSFLFCTLLVSCPSQSAEEERREREKGERGEGERLERGQRRVEIGRPVFQVDEVRGESEEEGESERTPLLPKPLSLYGSFLPANGEKREGEGEREKESSGEVKEERDGGEGGEGGESLPSLSKVAKKRRKQRKKKKGEKGEERGEETFTAPPSTPPLPSEPAPLPKEEEEECPPYEEVVEETLPLSLLEPLPPFNLSPCPSPTPSPPNPPPSPPLSSPPPLPSTLPLPPLPSLTPLHLSSPAPPLSPQTLSPLLQQHLLSSADYSEALPDEEDGVGERGEGGEEKERGREEEKEKRGEMIVKREKKEKKNKKKKEKENKEREGKREKRERDERREERETVEKVEGEMVGKRGELTHPDYKGEGEKEVEKKQEQQEEESLPPAPSLSPPTPPTPPAPLASAPAPLPPLPSPLPVAPPSLPLDVEKEEEGGRYDHLPPLRFGAFGEREGEDSTPALFPLRFGAFSEEEWEEIEGGLDKAEGMEEREEEKEEEQGEKRIEEHGEREEKKEVEEEERKECRAQQGVEQEGLPLEGVEKMKEAEEVEEKGEGVREEYEESAVGEAEVEKKEEDEPPPEYEALCSTPSPPSPSPPHSSAPTPSPSPSPQPEQQGGESLPTSTAKRQTLLSALGLQREATGEEGRRLFSPVKETGEGESEESLEREEVEVGAAEERETDYEAFLLSRYEQIMRLYEDTQLDTLPGGRIVPICRWVELQASLSDTLLFVSASLDTALIPPAGSAEDAPHAVSRSTPTSLDASAPTSSSTALITTAEKAPPAIASRKALSKTPKSTHKKKKHTVAKEKESKETDQTADGLPLTEHKEPASLPKPSSVDIVETKESDTVPLPPPLPDTLSSTPHQTPRKSHPGRSPRIPFSQRKGAQKNKGKPTESNTNSSNNNSNT